MFCFKCACIVWIMNYKQTKFIMCSSLMQIKSNVIHLKLPFLFKNLSPKTFKWLPFILICHGIQQCSHHFIFKKVVKQIITIFLNNNYNFFLQKKIKKEVTCNSFSTHIQISYAVFICLTFYFTRSCEITCGFKRIHETFIVWKLLSYKG